ncbi:MAG: MFS transporter [Acidimicrobiales bacterium]
MTTTLHQRSTPDPRQTPDSTNLHGDRYKWIALSNTTIGLLMATINGSIVLISLPAIFNGIGINPLAPANSVYLLWMLMGFLVVTAVLVVSLGRIGDIFGRVRMYNIGFAVFTIFSILLSITWMHGTSAALYIIIMRVFQGVGAAFLFANSSAIITDAFPSHQRGMALGINAVAAIAGSFMGLVLGGLLAPISWRAVFLVSVPFGLFGTVWAYLKLRDTGIRTRSKVDWWGNLLFAIGLISVMTGITYGIEPYGSHTMGWTNPGVLAAIIGGIITLICFGIYETKVDSPMFRLSLFRIRAFAAGNVATLLAAMGRGGLQFILIIWLQGVWLPEHGYNYANTPLWAGIYLIPLTIGFLIAGPLSGVLSDRFGARPFTTIGLLVQGGTYLALTLIPINFSYIDFAIILFINGLAGGLFAAPNQAGVMNSLPPNQRGSGAGMLATFQNSAQVLSIGIFFSLIIVGLSATLPHDLYNGLIQQGVPVQAARRVADLPPVGSLFAAFLGYNPIKALLGPTLSHMSAVHAAYLSGREFFPHLISASFGSGLRNALDFALGAAVLATVASWLRGGKFHHGTTPETPIDQATVEVELETAESSYQ